MAFFAANNATNNNKALEFLASELNINVERQQLRCLGHIINLVSTAILYGVNEDCVKEVLEALNDDADADGKAIRLAISFQSTVVRLLVASISLIET